MGDPALQVPSFDELYREIQALPEGVTGEILGAAPGGSRGPSARRPEA